ncbi:hypothetical protein MAR_023463 [Mya arenaria]|uniref:Uncharacterized protein n=1 Tax=Mya arenaria TaxID=6604 RepID=A0ABY7DQY5_MYAAR|nr:hypothetical protein MAR_023463 [Mya arenaria]
MPQDLHSAERLTQRAAQLGSHEAQLELLLRSPENLKADKKSNAQKRKGNKTSKQSAHGSYLTLPSLTDLVQDSISSSHKPSDTESLFDKIKPLIPELLLSESMVVTRATESTPSVNDNGYSKQKAVHKTGSKKTAPKISQSRSGSELNNGCKFYLENYADDLSEVSADSLECAVESCSTLHRRHNTMPDLSIFAIKCF